MHDFYHCLLDAEHLGSTFIKVRMSEKRPLHWQDEEAGRFVFVPHLSAAAPL
jgi:hypothetical protein